MARPKKVVRSRAKNLLLPEDLITKVDLELFSELEGKVPFAAWQKFTVKCIENYFAIRAANTKYRNELDKLYSNMTDPQIPNLKELRKIEELTALINETNKYVEY